MTNVTTVNTLTDVDNSQNTHAKTNRKMKTINIIYWISTILFGGFMLMSGIQNAMVTPDSVALLKGALGYPEYIIGFIGVAKILGSIAIIIPGFPRLKEWAYAGLTFDLVGATYSMFFIPGPKGGIAFMLVFFILLFVSYTYHIKRQNARVRNQMIKTV